MDIKRNLKLLVGDLSYKNGFICFMSALMSSIFLLGIFISMIWFVVIGQANFLSCGAALGLALFILGSFGRDKKIDRLEKTIHEDKIEIDKLSKKDKTVSLEKIDRQMKDMQNE